MILKPRSKPITVIEMDLTSNWCVIANVHAWWFWAGLSGLLQCNKPLKSHRGKDFCLLFLTELYLWCLEHSSTENKSSVERSGFEWVNTVRTVNSGTLQALAFQKKQCTGEFCVYFYNVHNLSLQQGSPYQIGSKGKLSSKVDLSRPTN